MIFRNHVKRILRSKVQLIFILLFPLAFMSIGFIDSEPKIRIALIDQDQTKLTADLRNELGSKALIIEGIQEENVEKELLDLKIDYALIIDPGFTDAVIAGEESKLRSYSVKEANISVPIRTFLEQWITHARWIAAATNHQQEPFYQEFERYQQLSPLDMKKQFVQDDGRGTPRQVLGYLIMSMLYTSLVAALVILMNKNNHTLYRSLAAPIRMRSYMFQVIGSFLLISMIQLTFALLVLKLGFNMYSFMTLFKLFVLLVVFSLVSVSIGVMISAFSKNIIQACFIGICIIPPLSMIGGAYFPLDWASDTIISLSKFSPVSWVITGAEEILRGQNLSSALGEIIILLLFSSIFFLLGIIRKVDIAK